jgi:hypothetical protein
VIVEPGCRGRDNKAADGTYYGKAPAAIVDLKAAVRYIRHNQGVLPGDDNWIVSAGCSAGGALSAILGASGNSPLYDSYLKEVGAADGDDSIFAAGCGSPIVDLDHADGAYEWMFGTVPLKTGLVDQDISKQLKAMFATYQASLKLKGRNGFGTITADNYSQYLLKEFLIPSANKYLRGLADDKRKEYLDKNTWITWDGNTAKIDFAAYVSTRIGRQRTAPGFDDFEMKQSGPILFGTRTIDARPFTNFGVQHATGNPSATVAPEIQTLVNMFNPMYFIEQHNPGVAGHWWIRHGAAESSTSQTVPINLVTILENQGKDVNAWLYWDAGHCVDQDPEGFVAWVGKITGYKNNK